MTVDFDEKYMNASFSVGTTENGNAGVFNSEVLLCNGVLREQLRYKLYLSASAEDDKYSQLFLSTTIDVCKIGQGKQTNIITKTIMESLLKSSNLSRYQCPAPTKVWIVVKNCTITDRFLPPIPFEKKFLRKQKGWKYMFSMKVFGRVKK